MKTNFEERRAVYQTLCAYCKEKACARSTDCEEFNLSINAVKVMNTACMIIEEAGKVAEEADRNFKSCMQIILRCAERKGGANGRI